MCVYLVFTLFALSANSSIQQFKLAEWHSPERKHCDNADGDELAAGITAVPRVADE